MAKPNFIELPTGEKIPILYEDRSVIAIDKARGWMLVPFSWLKTGRNLQAALISSIAAGDFWARSRGLRFLRFVHRLDAETTGILLLAKSPGAVTIYGSLFESRKMEKLYLAVVLDLFPSVKSEVADRFDSCGEAKMELFDYIEVFYNQRRRHSTLGQISPAAFERQAMTHAA